MTITTMMRMTTNAERSTPSTTTCSLLREERRQGRANSARPQSPPDKEACNSSQNLGDRPLGNCSHRNGIWLHACWQDKSSADQSTRHEPSCHSCTDTTTIHSSCDNPSNSVSRYSNTCSSHCRPSTASGSCDTRQHKQQLAAATEQRLSLNHAHSSAHTGHSSAPHADGCSL